MENCRCLYCRVITGSTLDGITEKATVCSTCVWSSERDEAREIAAGMGPWSRPLSFWVGFFHQHPAEPEFLPSIPVCDTEEEVITCPI